MGYIVDKGMCQMLRLDLLLHECLTWYGGSLQRVKVLRRAVHRFAVLGSAEGSTWYLQPWL